MATERFKRHFTWQIPVVPMHLLLRHWKKRLPCVKPLNQSTQQQSKWCVKRNSVTNLFLAPGTAPTDPRSRSASPITNTRSMRSPHIRILVLGPPVGYPRCFDDYYYYNVEVMVSGPEVAQALMHWVANPAQRKRTLVERAAQEAKQRALSAHPSRRSP